MERCLCRVLPDPLRTEVLYKEPGHPSSSSLFVPHFILKIYTWKYSLCTQGTSCLSTPDSYSCPNAMVQTHLMLLSLVLPRHMNPHSMSPLLLHLAVSPAVGATLCVPGTVILPRTAACDLCKGLALCWHLNKCLLKVLWERNKDSKINIHFFHYPIPLILF